MPLRHSGLRSKLEKWVALGPSTLSSQHFPPPCGLTIPNRPTFNSNRNFR
jgi:hypothetical protein